MGDSTSTTTAPLIGRDDEERGRPEDAGSGTVVDESALVSPGLFIWALTICAGVSGLLFGYE